MKRFFWGAALALLLAGCIIRVNPIELQANPDRVRAEDRQAVQAGVVNQAVDPAQVRLANLRAWRLENGDRAICGLYDAPDSNGDFAGYLPFFLRTRGRTIISVSIADIGARLPTLMAQILPAGAARHGARGRKNRYRHSVLGHPCPRSRGGADGLPPFIWPPDMMICPP